MEFQVRERRVSMGDTPSSSWLNYIYWGGGRHMAEIEGPKAVAVKITRIDEALERAPVIFVDGAQGFAFNGEVAKFNFFQDVIRSQRKVEPDDDLVERVVCARMVMTKRVLIELKEWLDRICDKIEEKPEAGNE